jgi:alpha-galactosidase
MINIENDGIAKIRVKGGFSKLKAVKFISETDVNELALAENEKNDENGTFSETEGHIFILEKEDGIADVFIVAVPDYALPTISFDGETVTVKTFGYPVSHGRVEGKYAEALCRYWYRMQYKPEKLIAMSNTWGDRNGRTRVCDEFIRCEIDSAEDLGLDVVQIDDGWQKGVPNTYAEDGLRIFEGDFWEVKRDLFPEGLESLSKYAKEHGVELGLWFAPHSRDAFLHFERDVSILKKAYSEWKMRYFKLDMLQLVTEEHVGRMFDFLDEVTNIGDGVEVQLDVTADKRLGYLSSAPYGTIFVENRYTAWANYYPHKTLRNLWLLSKYIPASKFQFELVNPELYKDKYAESDELRPELYDVDYLFASVMLSNPLFWMETQFLSEKNRYKLKRIMSKWKAHREKLKDADVYPVGAEPSGKSITGFFADCEFEKHVILFREVSEKEDITLDVGFAYEKAELVESNSDVEYSLKERSLKVSFSEKRSYAWLILR